MKKKMKSKLLHKNQNKKNKSVEKSEKPRRNSGYDERQPQMLYKSIKNKKPL